MYIQGKVLKVFEVQTGESQRGPWRKREFLIETFSKVPKKVNLCLRGESVDSYKIQEGESLKINIDIESREHNGRWYTEIRAWKIEPAVYTEGEHDSQDQDYETSPF